MTDELLNERYALAIERIRQIPAEKSVPQPYRDFFAQIGERQHSTFPSDLPLAKSS